jgi:Nif-specific regulatory protein
MDQMVLMQDTAAITANERFSARADLALLGIYEISKLLCGPGSLQDVLSGTMCVLHSFLDMGNGVIALIDSESELEDVFRRPTALPWHGNIFRPSRRRPSAR